MGLSDELRGVLANIERMIPRANSKTSANGGIPSTQQSDAWINLVNTQVSTYSPAAGRGIHQEAAAKDDAAMRLGLLQKVIESPLTKLGLAFGATVKIIEHLNSMATRSFEENRNYSTYSGTIAAAYSAYDAAEMQRTISRAQAVAPSAATLAWSQNEAAKAWEGPAKAIEKIGNKALAAWNIVWAGAGIAVGQLTGTQEIEKTNEGPNLPQAFALIESAKAFANDRRKQPIKDAPQAPGHMAPLFDFNPPLSNSPPATSNR